MLLPLQDRSFQAQGDSFFDKGPDKLLCFGRKQNSNKCRRNRQDIFLEYTKETVYAQVCEKQINIIVMY